LLIAIRKNIYFITINGGNELMITINSIKCTGCKRCARVCPHKVIEINDINKAEAVRQNFCIHCAHCISVCPANAISSDFNDSILGRRTKNIDMPTSEQVENFMLTRRSIRVFSKKDVEREKILKILQIAVHAPTTHNQQNVKFIVAGHDKTDELETLAHDYYISQKEELIGVITREAGFKVLSGAPVTIALYADKCDKGDFNLALWNCLVAAQNLLIAAHGMGLGGCYNGLLLYAYSNDLKLQKFFNMPEDMKIYMFVELGYTDPAIKYRNIIIRKNPDVTWM
jgi:nitroreductase/NAD-dependent dihydropyrimidine dehydrogenase PreA subunit